MKFVDATQMLGRALMLPIAVLPVAGLLLRLGQPDLLNIAPMAAAGDAIFSNLGLLFAIGVAVGLARENHGASGLAAVVAFLVATKGAEALVKVPADVLAAAGASADLAAASYKAHALAKLSVPLGILSGLAGGGLYNRYAEIRLPSYLAFFAGRRFVPIVAGCAGLVLALAFGYGWPYLEHGMDVLSAAVLSSGSVGLFAYGVLNRILIVTGLHHILNNLAWFLIGDYHGVTGDLKRFFAGDPTAGIFMSGFFPVMMFGLPAACLAMYRTARPERRRAAGGLLLSMALTSLLTGVTEPIEFSFMFLAPALYALHAVLTGTAMVVMKLLDVHLGFSFSAGLFDYVLGYGRATHPLYLIPVGLVYFGLYYGLFRYAIVRFNLKTPGREDEASPASSVAPPNAAQAGTMTPAHEMLGALGGAGNLVSIDACTTRLRLVLVDRNRVDYETLKRLGARGFVKPGDDGLQVVLGPIADQVATDLRRAARSDGTVGVGGVPPHASAATAAQEPVALDADVLEALGGSANILSVAQAAGRLLVAVRDENAITQTKLDALYPRGVARCSGGQLQLLTGPV